MTIIKDHIALIGNEQIGTTSAIVAERYRKFVAPYVAHPATFEKVETTDAERREHELEIMRSRGDL